MQSNTEGILIAGCCLTVSLLSALEAKGLFTKDDVAQIYDSASLALPKLDPASMSPEAREFASKLLEVWAKQTWQPPR